MNNTIDANTKNRKIINIIYLDDENDQLTAFSHKISKFNISADIELDFHPVGNFYDLLDILKNQKSHTKNGKEFDVIICDQNLPDKWTGVTLIEYLKREYKNHLYVIYTGNPSEQLREQCERLQIILLDKTFEFETVIDRLRYRLFSNVKKYSSDDPIYKSISEDVINDMTDLENSDPTFIISIGNNRYKPLDIINHVRQRTQFGEEYILNYVAGLKIFKLDRND